MAKLDIISVQLVNMFRDKKKTSKAKPEEQWQPDYVKEAKEQARLDREASRKVTEEQLIAIKRFWRQRNPEATFIEE